MIDANEIYLYQKENNSIWYTNADLICDRCNKKSDAILDIYGDGRYCWQSKKKCKRSCSNVRISKIMMNPLNEEPLVRLIFNDVAEDENPIIIKKKRDPIGLALRFAVLKRDGYQCVICGKSGKEAKLQIDHILPFSLGGGNSITNLQVLCFECNNGKRNTIQ